MSYNSADKPPGTDLETINSTENMFSGKALTRREARRMCLAERSLKTYLTPYFCYRFGYSVPGVEKLCLISSRLFLPSIFRSSRRRTHHFSQIQSTRNDAHFGTLLVNHCPKSFFKQLFRLRVRVVSASG
jgi:hypothetical protein